MEIRFTHVSCLAACRSRSYLFDTGTIVVGYVEKTFSTGIFSSPLVLKRVTKETTPNLLVLQIVLYNFIKPCSRCQDREAD